MADIMKMYRFIQVNELDFAHQRILWWYSPKHAISESEYELTTGSYGTTSAPYLAVRTLQQLAIDEQKNYPIASQATRTLQDFYVDDILSGESQESAAQETTESVNTMLNKGGFKLWKWSSNFYFQITITENEKPHFSWLAPIILVITMKLSSFIVIIIGGNCICGVV